MNFIFLKLNLSCLDEYNNNSLSKAEKNCVYLIPGCIQVETLPFRLDIYGLLLTIVKRVTKFLNLDHRPRKRSCISIESSNTLKRTENGLFSSVTDTF